MRRLKIPIRPAGMLSDITENDLQYFHEEVVNLKHVKKGEWEIPKGPINGALDYSGTNIKSGIEISDDLSGDRFILYQEGTVLYRVDYDISNSPKTGYESETPSALTLPSGVTIAADDTLRFFYHNGIVRITGASAPVWYGYIKDRKLFYKGYQTFYNNGFESSGDENDFTSGGDGCVRARSTSHSYKGSYSMLLISAFTPPFGAVPSGYAYQAHSVTKGNWYHVSMNIYKASGQISDSVTVKIGTAQNTGDIDEVTLSQVGNIPAFPGNEFLMEFKAKETQTIYITIVPFNGCEIYVDEYNILEDSPHISVTDGWYCEKASLNNYSINLEDIYYLQPGAFASYTTKYSLYFNSFLKYDKSQYSLRSNIVDASGNFKNVLDNAYFMGMFYTKFRVYGQNLTTTFLNERLTGFGISFNRVDKNLPEDDVSSVWRVADFIDFTDHLAKKPYTKSNIEYSSLYPNRISIRVISGTSQFNVLSDGFFQIGQYIKIGSLLTKITNIEGLGTQLIHITISDTVDPYLRTGSGNLPDDTPIIIYRGFDYDATLGFITTLGLDCYGAGGGVLTDFIGFPSSTIENTPDYSHHQVVDGRAYCLSNEDQEQDTIRYSPQLQFDNFPIGNVVQTPVGDIDQNLGLIERDNRFVVLKRHSISQGQFSGASYYHDKSGKKHGLYATKGYIVINDILYFMDNDDVYLFAGVQVEPWLENARMRELYRQYVSEDSFFAYNSDDGELWLCLNGIIIAYDFSDNSFYLRNLTGVSPRGAFRTFDNKLHIYDQYGFIVINHDESTYDFNLTSYFKTRLIDLKKPEQRKQLRLIYGRLMSNDTITVTVGDANEPVTSVVNSYTPDTAKVALLKIKDIKYIFREMYLKVQFPSASSAKSATVKSFDLLIRDWK